MRFLATLLISAVFTTSVFAAETCTEDAMIVFDGSGSMSAMGYNGVNEPRIIEARRAVRSVMPEIAMQRALGLLVYGPGGRDECSGLDLRFSPRPNAAQRIIDAVEDLEPEGKTALTAAVRHAAEALDYRTMPATIVLITDGNETCGGAPCRLAEHLASAGHDTKVHVIGFRVRGDFYSWRKSGGNYSTPAVPTSSCLADTTGGSYVSAETLHDLVAALRVTLGCNLMF